MIAFLSSISPFVGLALKIIAFFMKKSGAAREDWLALIELSDYLEKKGVKNARRMIELHREQDENLDKLMSEMEQKRNDENKGS